MTREGNVWCPLEPQELLGSEVRASHHRFPHPVRTSPCKERLSLNHCPSGARAGPGLVAQLQVRLSTKCFSKPLQNILLLFTSTHF